jgi:predicted CXXCH cytochrome family protein
MKTTHYETFFIPIVPSISFIGGYYMRTLHLTLVAVIIACFALPLQAQVTPPVVIPLTFGVSGYLAGLDSTDAIDVPSNGLPNVAPNSKVYLTLGGKYSEDAPGGDGEAWASATWTLATPDGSTATIEMLDAFRAYFVPDLEGTYTVSATGTDDQNESASGELKVNVAKFVGVGGITGDPAYPECATCHGAINDTWKLTEHATSLSSQLDDPDGHFQTYCLACHTTGSSSPMAEGDGFIHLSKSSSWTFPTTLGPGNWDALIAEDAQLAARGNVQCEACHGPGSAHGGPTADNKMVKRVTEDMCLRCHDAPTHHYEAIAWRVSGHGKSVGGTDDPWHMNRGSSTSQNSDCARCHTSAGYIDVMDSGKPYDESFTNAPYDDPGHIGCPTCHDPHDGTNEHQLRAPAKDLCITCHHVRVSGYSGLHHSHQGSMVAGVDGKEFPGYTYRNSGHTYIENGCAGCHMAPAFDPAYDNILGKHTFNVMTDNGTPDDPTDDVLNTEGCSGCHGTQANIAYVEETQDEIHLLLDELNAIIRLLRPDGRPVYPSDDTLTTAQADIHFNWYFVAHDASYGVHNKKYSIDLLKASIAEAIKVYGPNSIDQLEGVANGFALEQNYPNPFNPSTSIVFSVPKTSNVSINIYDATGRLVNVLVNGQYSAGNYQVSWNGTTELDTRMAPSGIYFYRIVAGDYTASKKMVLMK